MKVSLETTLFFSLIIGLTACVPTSENDFNQYEIASEGIEGSTEIGEPKVKQPEPEEPRTCKQIDYRDECEEREECQPVFEEFGDKFIGCTEKPEPKKPGEPETKEPEEPETKEPGSKKPEEPRSKKPGGPETPGPEISEICQRGNSAAGKHIMICHVPPGNPGAAHTICIARQGWENGHKGRHVGKGGLSEDYLGACVAGEGEEEEEEEEEEQ